VDARFLMKPESENQDTAEPQAAVKETITETSE
jgi:hypothetical protein